MRLLICMVMLASLTAADPGAVQLNNDAPYRAAVARLLASPPAANAPARVLMEWHWQLASAYMDLRRYDLGETEARAALRLAPGHPTLHSNLSVMLGKQGKFAEALAEAQAALAIDPDHLHARLVLPSWELGAGQREAALLHFQAIPKPGEGKDLRLYYSAQACFYADVGDAGKTAEGIREALARDTSGNTRTFFARDLVFDRYRAESWFVTLVGATLNQAY